MDQNVKDAIAKLIEDGKITKDESQAYFPDLVDKVGLLGGAMHTLMCKQQHNDNITNMGAADLCDY